jgi:uncharacterized alkaline shock family protein YloU
MTGRTLVTRRAIVDIVRGAVLGSYGVTGVDAGPLERLLGRIGLREPGIRVRLDRGLEIDLHLTVGYGVPVAEVARQIDSAVRYAIRHALDRDVRRLAVHVGGLRYQPASVPPRADVTSEAAAPEVGRGGPDPVAGPVAIGGRDPFAGVDAAVAASDAAVAPVESTEPTRPSEVAAETAVGARPRTRPRGPRTNGRDAG